eukprot:8145284-Pyramimonas_sp.AAC.1
MRSSQPISAKNAWALKGQLGQSSSLPLNSGSAMSPLQSASCSLGAAAMGNARPQSSRGSDP